MASPEFRKVLRRHRRAQITARVSGDAPSPRVDSRAPLTIILRAMLATPRASVSPPRADAASRHRVSSSRRVVARDAAARAVAASADRLAPAAADLASRPDPRPDHARHRDAVLSQLPEGKLVYVPGGTAQTRNGVEGNARFRQEPDFLYLTGVEEPGYRALFGTGADAPFVLIAPRQPPRWTFGAARNLPRTSFDAPPAPTLCISRTSTIRRSTPCARWKARPSSSRRTTPPRSPTTPKVCSSVCARRQPRSRR